MTLLIDFIVILLLIITLLVVGNFLAYYSISRIQLFKKSIFIICIVIGVSSVLLIYTDVLPINILISIITVLRWAKYVYRYYPFIDTTESMVTFGTSAFLTCVSIVLWFCFEFLDFETFHFYKIGEFISTTILIPYLILFTICFKGKSPYRKDKSVLHNYFIEHSTRVKNHFVTKATLIKET